MNRMIEKVKHCLYANGRIERCIKSTGHSGAHEFYTLPKPIHQSSLNNDDFFIRPEPDADDVQSAINLFDTVVEEVKAFETSDLNPTSDFTDGGSSDGAGADGSW